MSRVLAHCSYLCDGLRKTSFPEHLQEKSVKKACARIDLGNESKEEIDLGGIAEAS